MKSNFFLAPITDAINLTRKYIGRQKTSVLTASESAVEKKNLIDGKARPDMKRLMNVKAALPIRDAESNRQNETNRGSILADIAARYATHAR